MLRHVADDPVRAVTLAWRALPATAARLVGLAGPYGRAAALWGAGDRRGALTALEASPARLAAFSLAVDQPTVARSALARLSEHNGARPRLAARLAYREGRLTDAVRALDGARGWRAARLRRCAPGRDSTMLEPDRLQLSAGAARGRGAAPHPGAHPAHRHRRAAVDQRRLHHPHPGDRRRPARARASTRTSSPGSASRSRRARSTAAPRSPWTASRTTGCCRGSCPAGWTRSTTDAPAARRPADRRGSARRAARRVQLRQRGHRARAARRDAAAGRLRGARLLGGHLAVAARRRPADLKLSDRYVRTRALETHCMTDADLVVTLGEAMRDEIIERGVDPDERHHRPQRGQRGVPAARCPTARGAQGQPRHQAGRARRRPRLQPGRARGHRHPARGGQDPGRPGRPDPRADRRRRPGARPRCSARPPASASTPSSPAGCRWRRSVTTTPSSTSSSSRAPRTGSASWSRRSSRSRRWPAACPSWSARSGRSARSSATRRPGCCSRRWTPARSRTRSSCCSATRNCAAKLGANASEWVARDRTWAHNAARYREAYAPRSRCTQRSRAA